MSEGYPHEKKPATPSPSKDLPRSKGHIKCWNCGIIFRIDLDEPPSRGIQCPECGYAQSPNEEIPWSHSFECFCGSFLIIVVIIAIVAIFSL